MTLAHKPEQDVLRADVVVAEQQRLAQRELEHLLRPRRERNLAARGLFPAAHAQRDGLAQLVDPDPERGEHSRREALLHS